MRELLLRAWYLIRRRQIEADLAEELAFHQQMKERDLVDQGLAPRAAAAAAQRAVGSATLARDQARDVWIWWWLQDLAQDVRFAARLLRKDRRFTLASVVALSLGIGANTTIFTFINTALIKELPFGEPRRLVALGTTNARGALPDAPGPRRDGVSYADLQDWRAAARALSGIAADTGTTINLSDENQAPERISGSFISANAFDLLQARPVVGRGFGADDDRPGAPPTVVLGHALWQRRYNSDPSIVGRTVRVNNVASRVIGVMPPRFTFPMTVEAWQPLSLVPGLPTARRDSRTLNVTARLADGVTMAQAREELTAIAARLALDHPETNRDIVPTVAAPMENVRRSSRPFLMTLMGAVGFVLLIGCANVANLLLARAASRAREIAIRASLGATRGRIVRQLLIESVLVAAVAGLLGLLIAVYGVRYFGVAFDAMDVGAPDRAVAPYWVDLTMDGRVFAFVAALCLGSSILFGTAPALHVSRVNMNDVLKDAGPGAAGSLRIRRWTSLLMIGELALTFMLLSGAGLLARSFLTQYRVDLQLETAGLYTARLALPIQKYGTPELQKSFVERLDRRLASDSRIVSATIASDIPFVSLGGSSRRLAIDGRAPDGTSPRVSMVRVGGRYFETLGLGLVTGRGFADTDTGADRAAAIVNERFATRFFPDQNPIGHRIRLEGNLPGTAGAWLTIAGGVRTLPQFMPSELAPEPVVYVPLTAEAAPLRFVSIIVRGRAGDASTVARLREDVRALDPDLPLFAAQSMDDSVTRTRYPLRMIGSLFGFLALIALMLASVGLFALTAHNVAARTKEIGVRMALGARTRQVLWLFVRRTLGHLAFGLVIGVSGALAVGRLLQTFLAGTNSRDPLTMAAVTALLVLVSLAACYFPARRAARLDPLAALRHE